MSNIVVDASVALAWCFPDEASDYADEVLLALDTQTAVEPAIWGMEIANGILVGERRNRIQESDIRQFAELLDGLNIVEDLQHVPEILETVLSIARTHGIAVYDAAYLELAVRHQAPLATLDVSLQRAAQAMGVPTLNS